MRRTPQYGVNQREFFRAMPIGPVIVEAGAHHGEDTQTLARFARHVHAFEPIPDCYVRLAENVKQIRNVTTWPTALGGEEIVSAPMWVCSGRHDASSSLLEPKSHFEYWPDLKFSSKVNVPVTTLADWSERNKIGTIDGLWLDMQGLELAALQAAGDMLDTVQAIVLEVTTDAELYDTIPTWDVVRPWLEDQGFFVQKELLNVNGSPQGDVLVVR